MEPSNLSPIQAYQRQLESYYAARDNFWQSVGMRQGMAQQQMQGGLPALAGQTVPQREAPQPMQYWDDPDLIGSAVFWGIPEEVARQMPKYQLMAVIENYRAQSRPEDTLGAVGTQLAALPAMAAVGVGQAITGGLTRLPIVGESLKRLDVLKDADLWFRTLEEGVRASTPESQDILNTLAEGSGHLGAMWYPGAAAWAAAGKVGRISSGLRASKHAMAAWQGAASTYLLEGNSDLMKQHPVLMMGGGALLGTAFEAAVPWLAENLPKVSERITKSFVPDFLLRSKPRPSGAPNIPERQFGDLPELQTNVNAGRTDLVTADDQLISLANAGDENAQAILDFRRASGNMPEIRQTQPLVRDPAGMEIPLSNAPELPTPAGLNSDEAIDLSVALNKAGTVTQAPDFATLASRTQLDDVTVAQAAISTNPGGSHVVQGVSDPATFAATIAPEGYNIAFAQRGKRLDALIHWESITPEMIGQYERTGFYVGQSVRDQKGTLSFVREIKGDEAVIADAAGNMSSVKFSRLHNNTTSPGIQEVPQLWDGFQAYTTAKLIETSQAMGGAISPQQLAVVKTRNLSTWAEGFLDDIGIADPASRERILNYFSNRYTDEFKALAPVESIKAQSETKRATEILSRTEQPAVQRADETAATKGFVIIPEGQGYLVQDITSASRAQMRFSDLEAAETALKNIQRELPDVTPPSDVPIQIVPMHLREATQGANTNATTITKAVESIGEIADGGAGAFVGGPPPAVSAADGNVGRLRSQWTDGFLRWRPARRFFSQIDQAMQEASLPTGVAADYDVLSNMTTIHHNTMHPFQDRLTDITRQIKSKRLVDGEWGRFWMMGSGREAIARQAGLPEKEIKLFAEFDKLLQDIGGNADEARGYFSHIAKRQSDPALTAKAFDDFALSPATEPFRTKMMKGNLNLREFDPRYVGEAYIRSIFWQKDMAGPVAAVKTKWFGSPDPGPLSNTWTGLAAIEEMKPVAHVMKNWLDIIENGYHAEDDLALDVMHGTLRALLGPEVSKAQARELFNFGLNATHSGLLGFRLHVMARDALQLLFAVPRAGDDLLRVMAKASSNKEYLQTMWNDALDAGAIALQSPRTAAPGSFVGELEAVSAGLPTRDMGIRMKAAAKVTGAVRDLMPAFLRDTRDSPLHAMYFYGKQSEFMRALVYTAGKDKAARAIEAFRAAGPAGDFQRLLKESGARTYDPAWQRQFERIIATGADDKAAQFMGRQLADATQFKYGVTESPWAAKSVTGRVAMQMGNYSMQYFQYLRESITAGTRVGMQTGDWSDLTKMLLTMGAVTAGLEAATRETGWNFRWMNPYFGLGFTGGPMIGAAADISRAVGTVFQQQQGRPAQERVVNAGVTAAERTLSNLNPAGGLVRTAQGIVEAGGSPNPAATIGRLLVTGERGAGLEIMNEGMPQATAAFQQSLQPLQSPVSAGSFGTTVITPQLPTGPLDATGRLGNPWTAQPPAQVPSPGGMPYDLRPTPLGVTPDEVRLAAYAGYNPDNKFSRADLEFLSQFRNDTPENMWQGWLYYKEQDLRNRAATPQQQQQVPQTYPDSIPGAGAFY